MYSIERTGDLPSLLADATVWNRLAAGVPFRETSWLGPWWQHFGQDLEAYTLVARDDRGELQGILPLYRTHHGPTGRTLAMMGDGQAYSDFVSVIATSPHAPSVARAMGQFLANVASDTQDGWDVIDIDGISEGDSAMSALARSLSEGGAALHSQSRMSSWFRACDASWDDHIKRHGKTQRRKLRKWSKQIESTDGLQRIVADTDEQLTDSVDALIKLHQQRWTESGEAGSFADAEFESFIRDSAADFYSRGRLYLPTLTMNDRVVAAELHFIGGDNRLYCYSSGFDTSASELEPGRVLHVDTLMHLYRENLAGIDFLRGDEPYKQRAGAKPTRVLRMRAAAPKMLTQLRHAAWWTGFEVKQWMRKRAGRTPIVVVDMPPVTGTPLSPTE
tara:strand:- start:49161 stop:50330 length:1170 start_codon:yes stop_codon:yes gene_type:complete